MGRLGRERALARYAVERMLTATSALYEEVVAGRHSSQGRAPIRA